MNRKKWSLPAVALMTVVFTVAMVSVAVADPVVNNLDATADSGLETATTTAGVSVSVGFFITASNVDPSNLDASGCNATGANPAFMTISPPSGVTVSPGTLQFVGCGNTLTASFTAASAGTYTFASGAFSLTGGKSGSLWNTNPAAFTLQVNPAPPSDATPPVITHTITGTLGDNGWYRSDVTVTFSVSDPDSAITSRSVDCDATNSVTSDTTGVTFTCTATSTGGTSTDSVTIKRDATAPTISGSASPAANGDGWNNSDVTVSYTCDDNLSGVASCGADESLSSEGAGQSSTGTAVDKAGNSATDTVSGINIDKTAPTVAYTSASPSPNVNGWYKTDVVATFTATDTLSGFAGPSSTATGTSTTTGEGAAVTVGSPVFTDLADNPAVAGAATSDAFMIDKTAPSVSVTGVTDGAVYTLGSVPAAGCSTTDTLSGVAIGATPSTSGGPVGAVTATCAGATDNADNAASAVSVTYQIHYNWTGFFQPVDNVGWNSAKAGQAIPVKFNLGGNQGLDILKASFPKITSIACPGSSIVPDPIEEYVTTTAGGSALTYDSTANHYVYVWKTQKGYAGSCFSFELGLKDGSSHTFRVQFTK
ncbi:MAG TPA: PxKF domain-containing protein [Actinomycetota bacterium]|nr:PxKF domain-containing protein [Actinomycetota bacterium]